MAHDSFVLSDHLRRFLLLVRSQTKASLYKEHFREPCTEASSYGHPIAETQLKRLSSMTPQEHHGRKTLSKKARNSFALADHLRRFLLLIRSQMKASLYKEHFRGPCTEAPSYGHPIARTQLIRCASMTTATSLRSRTRMPSTPLAIC